MEIYYLQHFNHLKILLKSLHSLQHQKKNILHVSHDLTIKQIFFLLTLSYHMQKIQLLII